MSLFALHPCSLRNINLVQELISINRSVSSQFDPLIRSSNRPNVGLSADLDVFGLI